MLSQYQEPGPDKKLNRSLERSLSEIQVRDREEGGGGLTWPCPAKGHREKEGNYRNSTITKNPKYLKWILVINTLSPINMNFRIQKQAHAARLSRMHRIIKDRMENGIKGSRIGYNLR